MFLQLLKKFKPPIWAAYLPGFNAYNEHVKQRRYPPSAVRFAAELRRKENALL
ncbi:hypothetical protein CLOSTMETH_02401 [[Clostridium] methylpentosum DSM 5476]|uniref:Uncharacterized protein n=1 Tax=[Clostridium] methylpentosum DSM 5476 TaxID=537013 RepID=C0EEW2_9FIRM|nr:hypothetical protein CLOSTMETH_02401 [[Clostridium] methylpentosum DSM 5476]